MKEPKDYDSLSADSFTHELRRRSSDKKRIMFDDLEYGETEYSRSRTIIILYAISGMLGVGMVIFLLWVTCLFVSGS